MGEEMEGVIRCAGGSMSKLRAAAKDNADLQAACMLSVQPVRELLEQRYSQLDLKGTPFRICGPASQTEMIEMLSFCVQIDASIPQGLDGLHLLSKDLHSRNGLKQWAKDHIVHSEYSVSISKSCWSVEGAVGEEHYVYSGNGCTCKEPKMPMRHFKNLSMRSPLLPFPEPSKNNPGEWAKYDELKLSSSTSAEYRPSLSVKKAKRKSSGGGKVQKLGPKTVRTFYSCSNCGKPCLVYCSRALTATEQEAFILETEDRNGYCGKLPLLEENPLVRGVGVQVDTELRCEAGGKCRAVELNMYSPHIPKNSFPKPWPKLCFHCGSDHDVQTDQALRKVTWLSCIS